MVYQLIGQDATGQMFISTMPHSMAQLSFNMIVDGHPTRFIRVVQSLSMLLLVGYLAIDTMSLSIVVRTFTFELR